MVWQRLRMRLRSSTIGFLSRSAHGELLIASNEEQGSYALVRSRSSIPNPGVGVAFAVDGLELIAWQCGACEDARCEET